MQLHKIAHADAYRQNKAKQGRWIMHLLASGKKSAAFKGALKGAHPERNMEHPFWFTTLHDNELCGHIDRQSNL